MLIINARKSLLTAAFAVVVSASVARADGYKFAKTYPAFAVLVDAAGADLKLSGEEKTAALGHIDSWLAECKFKRIGEFLKLLRAEDILEIVKTAVNSKLVSDDGVPVAEDPAAYGQATLLSLPFDGVWNTVQGNNGFISHFKAGSQEFAWDFIIVHNNQQAKGNAQVNETHYCWGQPVLAPAPGVVAEIKDDLVDHPPYTPDPPKVGNHVYIDHENGELSLLYHLKQGSVMVKPGDRVKRGQPVGLCGDTGISTFPHLHYVLYKGTPKKHVKMETRFGGYFTLRADDFPGPAAAKMKLRLSGVPRRADFLMNAAELLKEAAPEK